MTNKTPISYYGGKQKLAHKIAPLIPRHMVYVELFAGGAAMLYRKPSPRVTNTDHYREVINDKSELLVNLWRVMRDRPDDFERACRLTPYSRAEHRDAKDIPDDLGELERARRYFYRINASFANNPGAGWGYGRQGRSGAATWRARVDRLPDALERLSAVHIECGDALDVIDAWDSPQTFFFADPPYPGADQGHYGGYTLEDFKGLVAALHGARGAWALSCYDQPCVQFAPDVVRHEFAATMTAARGGALERSRTEIVWTRARQAELSPDLARVMDGPAFDVFTGEPAPARHQLALIGGDP